MADPRRDRLIAEAKAYPPLPYGLPPGPGETDCSLYVLDVCRRAGLLFPAGVRTAEQERQACVPIGWDEVLPGDLLFFQHTYEPSEPPGPDGYVASHVGISLGKGTRQMYDARERDDSPAAPGITNIASDYWQQHLLDVRRLPQLVDAVPAVPGDGMPRGIDVSSHQGAVDWRAVAASGVAFAFTKATGGAWYTNPTLAANWHGMKAAGIKRGAYHFAFESSGGPGGDATAEVDYFLAAMQPLGLEAGDMLALDIEDGNGPLGQWALRWCQRVEAATGILPLIYTGAWFSVPHGFGSVLELARFPLWLAAYQEQMPAPPAPWKAIAFWQNSDAGEVPGVAGNVDTNLFNGPSDHLALYGKQSGVTPPAAIYAPPGSVGSGILELMHKDGTEPAMPSTWLPLGGQTATAEWAVGLNGRQYFWHLPTGRHWVYEPLPA